MADWAAIEPAFDLVARNEIWLLYQRDPDIDLPQLETIGVRHRALQVGAPASAHRTCTERSAGAADEPAGERAGELVVVDGLDAGDERRA